MKIKKYIQHRAYKGIIPFSDEAFSIKWHVVDVAPIEALVQMLPHRGIDGIINDLSSAATRDLEQNLPCIEGKSHCTR